ncbi:hypothetical protein FACS1894155_06030 [Bacteroidia bacterium]|nr:hypothetical protein FACS1894155_06030 [Bacteroidia bacterium]
MFKKIVIIEKSKIIREGLAGILYANEIGSKIICLEDFSEWNFLMRDIVPDMVILSPEMAHEGIEKLRSRYQLPDKVLFVGIVYQYYNFREITDIFDEVIFITDSEDVLKNKLKNLLKESSLHATASI